MPHHLGDHLDLFEESRRKIRGAYIRAVIEKMTQVHLGEFQQRIDDGDIEGAVAMLAIDNELIDDVVEEIRIAYRKHGQIAIKDLRPPPNIRRVRSAAFTFSVLGNPRAEEWILQESSNLIVEVVEQQRAMARRVISENVARGNNPREVAIQIVGRYNRVTRKREDGIIGLTNAQKDWVNNMKLELETGQYGAYLQRKLRDKRFDSTVRRYAKADEIIPFEHRKKIVLAYQRRALKYRADVIARTESLRAMNVAKRDAIEGVIANGGIKDRNNASRVWQATLGSPRTRDTHAEAHGQKRQIDQPFDIGGYPMMYPGDPMGPPKESIQCRCTTLSVVDWIEESFL